MQFQNSKIPSEKKDKAGWGAMWGVWIYRKSHLPFPSRLLGHHLAKPFVLRKNWNFGISTGYPQAKYLISLRKMTIPEKIPVGIKLDIFGIFVSLSFILGQGVLESREAKVLLSKRQKELCAFCSNDSRLIPSQLELGTKNWNGWNQKFAYPDALIKKHATRTHTRATTNNWSQISPWVCGPRINQGLART